VVQRSKKVAHKRTVQLKPKRTAAKKQAQEIKKDINKRLPKPKKYYITISGKKINLDNEIIKKYNLTPGDFLPFSRYKVCTDK
jgi:ribosomal protein L18E